nr:hypothetical protein [Tanacetum cinerariifolium]
QSKHSESLIINETSIHICSASKLLEELQGLLGLGEIPTDDNDKSSEVNSNDFASSDSSVKSSEPKPNDSTSCASTSSVSTSMNEAEIESNVVTPIQEPIIVQDLPSFSCNSFDKNENTSRTSCNKNVPTGSLPVPTGYISVPAGVIMVCTDDVPVYSSSSTDSFFDDEPTTRFPCPFDLRNHDPSPGVFSSSLYDDEFGATVNTLASTVEEEMQQFKFQNVWVLFDLPKGHRQDEGIDYDKVFALVSKIETIRLFLAFASYMGFMVYQMDVKSAFLYGIIDEEVYVTQPKGFVDPQHPKKVYKVVKALYGLHQVPRAWYATLSTFLLKHGYMRSTIEKTLFLKKNNRDIILVQVYVDDIIFGSTKKAWCLQVQQRPDGVFISQDKYMQEILNKFDLGSVRTATTPYEAPKPKSKNESDSPVNVHLYRSMIGSLMYLTASRPDIMFAVSACSRNQVTPTTSNLEVVKKIFKYLKGQPKLGLWYPIESPLVLEAYSESNCTGANKDWKSTTGGCNIDTKSVVRLWIPFPPLPPIVSPPSPILSPAPPPSPIRSLGYRAVMIRLRDEAASTSSPPLQLPSARESSSTVAARPAGGFRADYGFIATVDREIMRDPEREVGYEITDSWDEIVETLQGAPVSTDTELGGYVREDRRAHAYTRQLMETEARMSREAWVQATGEVMSLSTTVLGQMSKIRELQAADRRRQTGQVTTLQAQVTTLQGQQGLAGDHIQPELPEETGGNDSDKFSKVNSNDFASSDSSVKSSKPKPNDSTSCASTSSVSTSMNEAEIESNVVTPIQEPIIVQDLPSFSCNSSDKNENTSRTSFCPITGKVTIPPARIQPVPTGSLPVLTGYISVPAGVIMVSTDDVPVYSSSLTDSFFDDEPTTRFPYPFDIRNHDPSPGVFSSSSYDDEFGATLNTLASTVEVNMLLGLSGFLRTRKMPGGLLSETRLDLSFKDTDMRRALIMIKSLLQIDEEVYVTQPKDFIDPQHPKKVYKVVKALYGLHQVPRAWYATLSTFLLKYGYRRGTIEKTLFLKKNNRDIILVQVYMDDIIFGSTKKAWYDEFDALMKGEFQISAMGELTFFLGLQVQQRPDGVFISQDKYVQEILNKFDLGSVRTATTPYEAPKPKSKNESDSPVNVNLYRSMIGSLMYLTALRHDIMFAVSACSRNQVTPTTSNLEVVKKIFKYLKGQPKLGLWYPIESPLVLKAYSDSNYAGANKD